MSHIAEVAYELLKRISALEAERDRLALKVQQWEEVSRLFGEVFETTVVPARIVNIPAENARLRKIIEDAPHSPDCSDHRFDGCDCWKAALARTAEAPARK